MKRLIAIFCFTALLLSTSSLTYFYWVQEKMHEQERFASIEAGTLKSAEFGLNESSENTGNHQIKLTLKEKSVLPEGYTWEEDGREFSYKGQYYDIVSLKHTQNGWELIAASDEVETNMVANQIKAQQLGKDFATTKQANKFKISLVKLVYDCPVETGLNATHYLNSKHKLGFYNSQLSLPFLGQVFSPPKAV